jgi:plastocyanin
MALNKRRAAQIFAGMALIGLILVSAPATACISSHHDGMMGAAANRRPQSRVVSQSGRILVEIKDYDFFPRDLEVPVGATVTWVNRDGVPHDATDEGGGWATGMLEQGDQKSIEFDEPGAFDYLCTIHPDMKAKLVVRPDSAVAITFGGTAIE